MSGSSLSSCFGIDLERALLAIHLRIELDDAGRIGRVGIRVGDDLGALPHRDPVQIGLVDVDLGAQILEVGHPDEITGALEAAGHGDLADLLLLGEDDAVTRRPELRIVALHLGLRQLRLQLRDKAARRG